MQNAKLVKKVKGAKLPKRSDSSRKKKRVPWSSEYHTSKGNRIKVAFKTSVKEAGDITHGPHTYQHENVISVPPAFI